MRPDDGPQAGEGPQNSVGDHTLTSDDTGAVLVFESSFTLLAADNEGHKLKEPVPSPGNVLVAETSYEDNTDSEIFAPWSDEAVRNAIQRMRVR